MLKQLDILIGFTVVMAVVSLLITLVTQMVSAALGLRGKYLAEAVEAMIHKIDPTIGEDVEGLGRDLAKWVLTNPVLSDSLLLARERPWDYWWGIGWIRERWKVASAVRPDELFRVLQDVAGAIPGKAFLRLQELEKIANEAWSAFKGDKNSRAALAEELAQIAEEKRQAERDATDRVFEAAEKAQDDSAAAKELVAANLAAQTASKARIQAVEIAGKAHAAIVDDKKAKRFAKEMSMRAAAAKILAKLYRPQEPALSAPVNTAAAPQAAAAPIQPGNA